MIKARTGRLHRLPGNISLTEKLEPFAEQDGRGAIGIVNMQGQRREAARIASATDK